MAGLVGRLAGLGVADVDSVSLPGRVGEGRACWSLGNAYVSMGSPAQALTFAKKHLEISQEVSWACPPLGPQPLLCPHWRPPVLLSPPQTGWVPLCALVCSRLFPCLFRAVAECCTGAGRPCLDTCWLPICYSRRWGWGHRGAVFHP